MTAQTQETAFGGPAVEELFVGFVALDLEQQRAMERAMERA
jgi:hypothetical protein